MAMGEESYFGSGYASNQVTFPNCGANEFLSIILRLLTDRSLLNRMHWSDWGWETWWPEYDRPLGKPLGPFEREGKYKFSREFEHLSVKLDCDGLATSFEWH